MSEQKHDFDSPWKDVLDRYFPEFMEFFFEEAHADIDWQKGYEFLDSEFQKIVKDAELGRRLLDKLVKVWRKDGEETWVLAHIEVQGQHEADFTKRIYTYNYRIFDRHDRKVASLVILADESPDWYPSRYSYDLWGCKLSLEFPTVKLRDFGQSWERLESTRNPFGVVVMAHLQTMATRTDPESRLRRKFGLVKMLYEREYSKQDVIDLLRFIDWVMTLPDVLEARFWDDVTALEKEKKMPYMTSIERKSMERGWAKGHAKGHAKGRAEGLETVREALIGVLEARFEAPPPSSVVERVNRIEDLTTLKNLIRIAATVSSPHEFNNILEQRGA